MPLIFVGNTMFYGPSINCQDLHITNSIHPSLKILPNNGEKIRKYIQENSVNEKYSTIVEIRKSSQQKKKKLSTSWKLNLVIFSIAELFVGFTFSLLAPFYTEEATNKGLTVTQTGMVSIILLQK